MTDDRTEPWDDDRLESAFASRDQARPPSTSFIEPTLARVAEVRRPTPIRWMPRLHAAMGLLAVVAVIALVGSMSYVSHRPTTGRPTVSDGLALSPSAVPSASATPAGTALGLPIIEVSDAIAVRDAGFDDRELAVSGWFRPVPSIFACPLLLRQIRPVQFGCGDQFEWLTEDPIPVNRITDANGTFLPPKGPAIHPSFDQLGRDWRTTLPPVSSRCGRRPTCPPSLGAVSMVAIGHFDDRRAALCDANARRQCQDRFVVDRIDSIDDQVQRLSVDDEADGDRVWTIEDIERLDPLGPTESRLSVQVFHGGEEGLTLTPVTYDRLVPPAVWLIRDLVAGRAVTRTIVDGSSEVDEIRPDGSTVVLHAAPPSDWPPPRAKVITRPPSAAGSPRAFIAVLDESGHLVDRSRVGVGTLPDHDMSQRTVWIDAISPTAIVVRWGGGMCDHELVLTIRADANGRPDAILLDGRRDSPCRLALVRWAVVLRFDQPVDPADLVTQYGIEALP